MCDEIVHTDSDAFAGNLLAQCIITSYFGPDSYYPALGYRHGTESGFALTDIRTNQNVLTDKN